MPAEPSGMDRGTHTHEQKLSSRDSDSNPHPQLGPWHRSSPTMRVPRDSFPRIEIWQAKSKTCPTSEACQAQEVGFPFSPGRE